MTKINDNEKKTAVRSNDGSKKRKSSAFSHKKTSQTFWNLLRIENNFTLQDVADYTGFKQSTISAWFTGGFMPEDWQIKVLCDMFNNLSFEKGKLEMENAYTIFHGTHGTIDKEPRKAPEHVVEDVRRLSIKTEPEVKEDNYVNFDGVMRVLFSELTYDEYTEVQKLYPYSDVFSSKDKILKKLFDMLSWESYEKVRELLK